MIEDVFASALRGVAPFLILMALVFVGLAILKTRMGVAPRRAVTFPYDPASTLFTETEARFLRVLRDAAPGLDVFGKVRMEDVVVVRRGLSQSDRQTARNRIKPRHLDFVLTDKATTRVLCVVELDDASHATDKARQADDFKDKALAAAGVPIVRVRARSSYDVLALKERIDAVVRPPDEAALTRGIAPAARAVP